MERDASTVRLAPLRALVAESPGLLPGLLLVGVVSIWAYRDGGYAVTDWSGGALFLVALLVVLWFMAPSRIDPGRAGWLAILLLGAFTVWTYLGIAWAEVAAEAWTAANRTLLYLVVFALVALLPWRPVAAAVLLGAYSIGIGLATFLSFWQAVEDVDVGGAFTEGRLAAPIAYANANCALCVSAALPALYLASRREVPVALRGVFLAVTGVLAELALLTQSRASLIAVPVALALYFVTVPGRLRSALALALVSVAIVSVLPRLLDVYEVILDRGDAGDTLRDARAAIVRTAVVLFALGALVGLLDRRLEISSRISTIAARAAGGVVAVAAVLAIVVGFVAVSNPVARAQDAWDDFRNEQYVTDPNTPHLTSGFGSERYRLWRVAVEQFKEHPIVGVGGDNYAVTYLRERTDQSQPRYPHSVVLRTLAQTGLVGTVLLIAFLAAAVWGLWPRLRRGAPFARGVAGAGALVFAYWLVHGSIDWFWEIPVLGAPAFAFLALSIRVGEPSQHAEAQLAPRWRRPATVALVSLAVVSIAAIGPMWLSAREIDHAAETWRSDPGGAFDRLDRARSLNRLSDEPDVVTSVIASLVGDQRRQEQALRRALARNPTNWYPMVELAALETRRSRPERALQWLRRAETLNPREPTIAVVRQAIDAGKPVTSAELRAMYVDQAKLLTGQQQTW